MKLFSTFFLCLAAATTLAASPIRPVDLRCELRRNPEGIDTPNPRLGWVLEPASRSARSLSQSAYQVLVATRPELLIPGRADLWDSGKVNSGQSIHVRYGGKPMASASECLWRVRVWDQEGKASDWSPAARWSMGLLAAADWQAEWIGLEGGQPTNLLTGTQWIWHPGGAPEKAAPVGTVFFRRTLTIPGASPIKSALFLLAADNVGKVFVNGQPAGGNQNFRSATPLNIRSLLKTGENILAVAVQNSGDNPNPAGLVGLLRVEFAGGEPLVVATDAQWACTDKETGGWEKNGFQPVGWVAAQVLGPTGMGPWGTVSLTDDRRLPARHLRKEFGVAGTIRRATVFIAGLGLSELYLNGSKVSDQVLSPALSEYGKRVYYVTHDVTRQVKKGRNALGVILGNGRYFSPRLAEPISTRNYGFPKLRLQLRLEFQDGSTQWVASDASWKLTTEGPIRANNEYDGEEYDARQELGRWAEPGFDEAAWQPAQIVPPPGGVLSAQMIDPIRVTGSLKPVAVTEPQPGVFVFDLGQNLVGWCRLKVNGPRGTQVSLRHAETLKPDGTLYLDNIRGAKVTDLYTLSGRGREVYEPRFTYHGFRYVEVKGYPGRPTLDSLEGCVVNDDLETGGDWSCSQPTINQIVRLIHWGVRGNYRSIPTDCPQRDERQGWLGDRSAESKGETYLFRNGLLYAKWAQDMADAQREDGSVSDVCPSYWPLYNDNVTWPSSLVIIPGAMLDQYGDRESIERLYPSMARWIEHMSGYLTNNLMPRDTYGDWCVPPEDPKLIHSKDPARKTAGPILGTTYFHQCLRLMARYATLLGKPAEAERFNRLAGQLVTGLNAKYLDRERGQYDNGAQTTSVLPLAFGMVPADQRQRVFDHLVGKITRETKGHIGTGLVGGQWLNRVLAEFGREDLSYAFATNRTYPSWGYMIEKGATTVWELWNGDTADPAMNSGNHVMLVGDLVIWLYENLAGIQPDPEQPGFKHILMRPTPVGDLRFVRAQHQTVHGAITSHWRRTGDAFQWDVTLPPNTTATLSIPATDAQSIRQNGRSALQAPGLRFIKMQGDRAVFEAGSGQYRLQSRMK
jgi:alpha-L-rhamnosidase